MLDWCDPTEQSHQSSANWVTAAYLLDWCEPTEQSHQSSANWVPWIDQYTPTSSESTGRKPTPPIPEPLTPPDFNSDSLDNLRRILANPLLLALSEWRDEALINFEDIVKLLRQHAHSFLELLTLPNSERSTRNKLASKHSEFDFLDYVRRYIAGEKNPELWQARLWEDMRHLLLEKVVELKTTHFRYDLLPISEHVTARGEVSSTSTKYLRSDPTNTRLALSFSMTTDTYPTDTVGGMAENRIHKVTPLSEAATQRAAIEGQNWSDVQSWLSNPSTQVGESVIWLSPPACVDSGYLGAKGRDARLFAKETNHSFVWVMVKMSDTQADVTQYRSYQSLAEMLDLQRNLGHIIGPAQKNLSSEIIRNLVYLKPNHGLDLEKMIYEHSKNWLRQTNDLSHKELEAFWQVARQHYDELFLPDFWKNLQAVAAFDINDESMDEQTLAQAQQSIDSADLLTAHLVLTLNKLFREWRENPQAKPTFALDDSKKALAINQKVQKGIPLLPEEAAWMASAAGQAVSSALSWILSAGQCSLGTPFSLMLQGARASGGSLSVTGWGGVHFGGISYAGMIPLMDVQSQGLMKIGEWYVPGQEVWKNVLSGKCIGEACEGICKLFGECGMCAACDPRCVAANLVDTSNRATSATSDFGNMGWGETTSGSMSDSADLGGDGWSSDASSSAPSNASESGSGFFGDLFIGMIEAPMVRG